MENASTGNLPDGNHRHLFVFIIVQPANCRVSEYKNTLIPGTGSTAWDQIVPVCPQTPGKDETTCRDHPTGRNPKAVSAAERQTFQSTYHPLYQYLRDGTHGGRLRTDQNPDRGRGIPSFLSPLQCVAGMTAACWRRRIRPRQVRAVANFPDRRFLRVAVLSSC